MSFSRRFDLEKNLYSIFLKPVLYLDLCISAIQIETKKEGSRIMHLGLIGTFYES